MKLNRIFTAAQARKIDARAKDGLGIPVLVLMENAGRALAQEAEKILKDTPGRIAIFCGKGNNAGDGFAAARHLLTWGIKPEIFLVGGISEVKNEARKNLEILRKLRHKVTEVNAKNLSRIKINMRNFTLIIDGIFGVGLNGKVCGTYADLIRSINLSGAYVLAIDIPSGLDGTTGKILGSCVRADKTVTFVAKKRGMVMGDGPRVCGEIIIKDLGVPL